jgi:hypothetical protein
LGHRVAAGNPLRSIRRGVLSGGAETLKKYLRSRAEPGAVPAAAVDVEGVVATSTDPVHLWRVQRRDVSGVSRCR